MRARVDRHVCNYPSLLAASVTPNSLSLAHWVSLLLFLSLFSPLLSYFLSLSFSFSLSVARSLALALALALALTLSHVPIPTLRVSTRDAQSTQTRLSCTHIPGEFQSGVSWPWLPCRNFHASPCARAKRPCSPLQTHAHAYTRKKKVSKLRSSCCASINRAITYIVAHSIKRTLSSLCTGYPHVCPYMCCGISVLQGGNNE